MAELRDCDKPTLWVFGAIHWLTEHGVISGGLQLTAKGLALADQLQATGYKPTDVEICRVFSDIAHHQDGLSNRDDVMLLAMQKYRDRPDWREAMEDA